MDENNTYLITYTLYTHVRATCEEEALDIAGDYPLNEFHFLDAEVEYDPTEYPCIND